MKKFDPKNPWAVDWSPGSITCAAEDRLGIVKRCESIEELTAMIVYRTTQKTVREAAHRRIRVLRRIEAEKGKS